MAKKTDTQIGKIEREYTIPLRGKYRHVPRYKKTPKAVKEIKIFLAKHMRIRDRDLNKIKLDKLVNEYMWARGIKNPQHKIKVKAVREDKSDIVRVELVNPPKKLHFKKLRQEKQKETAKKSTEKKKKEQKPAEDLKSEEKEIIEEKQKSVEETEQKKEEQMKKAKKKTTSPQKEKILKKQKKED